MPDVRIIDLPNAAAVGDSVAPVTNAAGTATNRVTLQSIADLATPTTIGAAPLSHTHSISEVSGLQASLATKVGSDTTGITGADAIANIVSMTQEEYNTFNALGNTDSSTLYVIQG